jgi:hypothetical protein
MARERRAEALGAGDTLASCALSACWREFRDPVGEHAVNRTSAPNSAIARSSGRPSGQDCARVP